MSQPGYNPNPVNATPMPQTVLSDYVKQIQAERRQAELEQQRIAVEKATLRQQILQLKQLGVPDAAIQQQIADNPLAMQVFNAITPAAPASPAQQPAVPAGQPQAAPTSLPPRQQAAVDQADALGAAREKRLQPVLERAAMGQGTWADWWRGDSAKAHDLLNKQYADTGKIDPKAVAASAAANNALFSRPDTTLPNIGWGTAVGLGAAVNIGRELNNRAVADAISKAPSTSLGKAPNHIVIGAPSTSLGKAPSTSLGRAPKSLIGRGVKGGLLGLGLSAALAGGNALLNPQNKSVFKEGSMNNPIESLMQWRRQKTASVTADRSRIDARTANLLRYVDSVNVPKTAALDPRTVNLLKYADAVNEKKKTKQGN